MPLPPVRQKCPSLQPSCPAPAAVASRRRRRDSALLPAAPPRRCSPSARPHSHQAGQAHQMPATPAAPAAPLTGVGHGDVIDLIGVQPDLAQAAAQHRGRQPLLQLERHLRSKMGHAFRGQEPVRHAPMTATMQQMVQAAANRRLLLAVLPGAGGAAALGPATAGGDSSCSPRPPRAMPLPAAVPCGRVPSPLQPQPPSPRSRAHMPGRRC